MPFINTTQPIHAEGEPALLKAGRKEAFDRFVGSCMAGQALPRDRFEKLWTLRWEIFSKGTVNADALMIDILYADRRGLTVDLQAMFQHWIRFED